MVNTKILSRVFNRHYITRIFYHTNGFFIAFVRGTDFANRIIRNVMAGSTVFNLLFELNKCITKLVYFLLLFA
ncbi:hypothetical protein D3C85_1332730 [compost metagenome]